MLRRFIKNAGVRSHPALEGNIKITVYPHRTRAPDQLTPDLALETYDMYLPKVAIASNANVDETANNHSMPPTVEECASPMRMKRIKLGKNLRIAVGSFPLICCLQAPLIPLQVLPIVPALSLPLLLPPLYLVLGHRLLLLLLSLLLILIAKEPHMWRNRPPAYDAIVLQRLNPIAETEDGMLDR